MLGQKHKTKCRNRIDEIIVFKPLFKEQVRNIVIMQMQRLLNTLKTKNILLHYTPQAIDFLTDKGYDPQLGARPVKRAIQRLVTDKLSMFLLDDSKHNVQINANNPLNINLDCKNSQLVFSVQN